MGVAAYLEDNEHIALCDLLKLAGLVENGGQAKALTVGGPMLHDGETEAHKAIRTRGGEVIEFDGARLEVADGHNPEE